MRDSTREGRVAAVARLRRRSLAGVEALEGRRLLTITLFDAGQFGAFAGVGFALNPIAEIQGDLNGQPDNTPGDYKVQVNWGDGGAAGSKGVSLVADGSEVLLVKASHIYQTANTYSVTVQVTGPGGQTASRATASVTVTPLPDPASRPPSPPTSQSGPKPLGAVGLTLFDAGQFGAFAGVGFALNPIAEIQGSYDGPTDNTVGDYKAQVNWGDAPSWSTATTLVADGQDVLVKASHIYAVQGTYDVTVYVTGPDGQTASRSTATVTVTPLPDPASRPPSPPSNAKGPKSPGAVGLTLFDAGQFGAFAGVGFALNPIAEIQGSYDGPTDNTPGDYKAQVNWGDAPSWDAGTSIAPDGEDVLVKASHIYAAAGTYDVTVYVTGPDGQTASRSTATVTVTPLPDPTSQPVSKPATYPGARPLGVVGLTLFDGGEIGSLTGVELHQLPIGSVAGDYGGSPDLSTGDYKAQINWGDSGSWDQTALLRSGSGSVDVLGTHTYEQVGTFDVTLYVTGPDGQSASRSTATVVVGASSPPPPSPSSGGSTGGTTTTPPPAGTTTTPPPAGNPPETPPSGQTPGPFVAPQIPLPFPGVPPASSATAGKGTFNRSIDKEFQRLLNGMVQQTNTILNGAASAANFAALPPATQQQIIRDALAKSGGALQQLVADAGRDPTGTSAKLLAGIVNDVVKALSNNEAAAAGGKLVVSELAGAAAVNVAKTAAKAGGAVARKLEARLIKEAKVPEPPELTPSTTQEPVGTTAPGDFLTPSEFAQLPRSGSIDPAKIRFSQSSIKDTFSQGGSIEDLAASLKGGQVDPATIPPIRIVERDGMIFSLDNRRLKTFQEAGIPIRYVKLDKMPKGELYKFTTKNDGASIVVRGAKP